jgi:hypothetical protein
MDAVKALLAEAETRDGYRAAVAASEINSVARSGQRYEPIFVSQELQHRLEFLGSRVPLLEESNLIVLDNSADNGYPHTRANEIVCFPLQSAQFASDTDLLETLRHESIHLDQRRRPEAWASYCRRDGWTPLPLAAVPLRFRERCRINPDTMATPFWAWEGFHVPLPLFVRENHPTLGDVGIKWMDLRMLSLFPTPPPSFQQRYGSSPPQPEHPYELLAVEAAADGVTTVEQIEQHMA